MATVTRVREVEMLLTAEESHGEIQQRCCSYELRFQCITLSDDFLFYNSHRQDDQMWRSEASA